jgi:hypothetical protein
MMSWMGDHILSIVIKYFPQVLVVLHGANLDRKVTAVLLWLLCNLLE